MKTYAAMWSGGKDSALAVSRAREAGLEIGALLNFFDADSGRVRFHATRASLIAAQAGATGVPLRQHATTWQDFEATFLGALAALRAEGFAGVVLGDIHLADVRAWYEERVRGAGLEHVEPLWGDEPARLLAEFVASGGRAVITCVERDKLGEEWLGRVIDDQFPRDIAVVPIDPCGENGEYHSFAFAGPLFREPVPWLPGDRREDGRFAQLDLLDPREVIAEIAGETVRAHHELARGARASRPKAWGALSAQGIVAFRRVAGRAPDEREKRAIWDALWRAANAE